MAVVEELLELEDTSAEVVDFATVRTPPQTVPKAKSWPQYLGTIAQWVGGLAGVCAVFLTLYFHYAETASRSADEHVNSLIDAKLAKVMDKLDGITSRLDKFEGWREGLETRSKLQLQGIRAKIQSAEASKVSLPPSQLDNYRNTIRAIPSSSGEYWQTVAAIINYQSLIKQRSGEAPDPAKVARPCIGPNFTRSLFSGVMFRDCVVLLDTNQFQNVTFQDSVIQYRGGPVVLADVRFVNCRFVLELAANKPATPAQEKLLLALLNSPDQKIVQVPN